MRNLIALLAAFTLSTSTAVTAVACGTSEQTTTVIFDWNGVLNNKRNQTTEDFIEYLINMPEAGIGQSLYKDMVDYISLSILKTNPTFSNDYQFAKQSVENQIQNTQDSLRAKYGRSWENQWKKFLRDPSQGGDGQTGSYQRYFDMLLKGRANTIVSQYYVGDNYHNYQYYNTTEINIWLNDIFNKAKGNDAKWNDYLNNGVYSDKVWIVAKSFNATDTNPFPLLKAAVNQANSVADIQLSLKVAKTKDDKQLKPGDDYLIDPSNTIKGLLSNQQTKIAQVWMKNQGPIWTRQIVIPFNDSEKSTALQREIRVTDFSETEIKRIISLIQDQGFERALLLSSNGIPKVTSSSASGDLGLVTLKSDTSNIKPSFSYYLYRYVTSAQGIGLRNQATTPYNLAQYTPENTSDVTVNVSSFIETINRKHADSNTNQTSKYNDLVWMSDPLKADPYKSGKQFSGADDDKVAIFIDVDGIHFVQTPGIAYTSTTATGSTQDIITNYTQLLNQDQAITWNNAADVVNRPGGGLTNNSYLNFLQTQYLYWNANNITPFFDLNDSLNKFTSGSNEISSDVWWDYLLYFNNNIDNIHWNLSTALNTEINAPKSRIENFISAMKSWFTATNNERWNNFQLVTSDTLAKGIRDTNETWNGWQNAPAARLNEKDIQSYINDVAAQTIWWYDPINIKK